MAEGRTGRNNGWKTVDRRLLKVVEVLSYEDPTQMGGFLPDELPAAFTSADLAEGPANSRDLGLLFAGNGRH